MQSSPAMLLDSARNRDAINMARSIGILMVVLFHVIFVLVIALEYPALADLMQRLPAIFNVSYQPLGVDLIFLLSSFLLCYLMFREAHESGSISLREFYLKRVSRILPLYYLAIAVYGLASGAGFSELLWSALFVGIIVAEKSVIPVGWSTEAMMQAFILLPLLCMWVLRVRRPLLLIGILLLISVIVRVWFFAVAPIDYRAILPNLLRTGEAPWQAIYMYFLLPFRTTPFILGALLGYLAVFRCRELSAALQSRSRRIFLLSVGLILVVVTAFAPTQIADSWVYRVTGSNFWMWYWTLQAPAFAVGSGFVLLAILLTPPASGKWLDRVTGLGLWRVISENVYSVYLFHLPLVAVAAAVVFRTIDPANIPEVQVWHVIMIFLLAAAMATGLAVLLSKWIEVPVQGWLRRRFTA